MQAANKSEGTMVSTGSAPGADSDTAASLKAQMAADDATMAAEEAKKAADEAKETLKKALMLLMSISR